MLGNRLIKSNDAGGGACTNTVDLYNPFPDGGGVALYQLNGDATDESGNYDATTVNAITWGGAGEFGTSAAFNGSSSYIRVSKNSLPSNDIFTISLWFKSGVATSKGWLIGTRGNSATSGFALQLWDDGTLNYSETNGTSGSSSNFFTTNTYDDNAWHNVVIVRNSSNTFSLYVDGTNVIPITLITYAFTTNSYDLYLGKYTISNALYFNGSIDQVRIFNRALRPYEVEALYTEEYCTPTIVPSEHFNTNTWDGGTPQSINAGFEPDLIWIKSRGVANNHILADTVRGIDGILYSNLTNAEASRLNSIETTPTGYNLLDTWAGRNDAAYNGYVGWSWKAGGAAVTNTDGTITSQVSANTEAGFSIVSYTAGGTANVGHGLGSAPSVIITKNLDTAEQWFVYHKDVGTQKFLGLNTTSAAISNSGVYTSITDATYTNNISSTSRTYVNYCFAEVEGFSNFGSYVGTGASNTVVTGFEPAFVMIKCSSAGESYRNWVMYDNKRTNTYKPFLMADSSSAELSIESLDINFLSNGFELLNGGSGANQSGDTYIYMAFAADPTAVEPSLEDSFNTVTYTGNGTDGRQVTGVGFQPDLVWIKNRDTTNYHQLLDSVRGAGNRLFSNVTNAESFATDTLQSFDANGFTVGTDNDVNGSGYDIVAWAWKGAEIPAINSNGSIPSVVSANPAAGFSIVSYNSNGVAGSTIGHGLSASPNMIIIKNRDDADKWAVYHSAIGGTQFLVLNETAFAVSSSYYWNNTNPNLSVFTVGSTSPVNSPNNEDYIAYCFAEVAGFSKFGSYTGTGNTNGPTIDCGFEPAFVMIKASSNTGVWVMHDNKRGNYNDGDIYARLQAESSGAEVDDYPTPTNKRIVLSPTGFQVTNASNSWNGSGRTYIYMAFANQF